MLLDTLQRSSGCSSKLSAPLALPGSAVRLRDHRTNGYLVAISSSYFFPSFLHLQTVCKEQDTPPLDTLMRRTVARAATAARRDSQHRSRALSFASLPSISSLFSLCPLLPRSKWGCPMHSSRGGRSPGMRAGSFCTTRVVQMG